MAERAEITVYAGGKEGTPPARLMWAVADRYRLDPLIGQVEIITTGNRQRVYITRDGYIDIAHRSGQLDGIVLEEVREGESGWAATVSVYRKDMSHPFTYSAGCGREEAQARNGNGEAQAIARAERRALRRAFRVISDLGDEHGLEPDPLFDSVAFDAACNSAGLDPRNVLKAAGVPVGTDPAKITPNQLDALRAAFREMSTSAGAIPTPSPAVEGSGLEPAGPDPEPDGFDR